MSLLPNRDSQLSHVERQPGQEPVSHCPTVPAQLHVAKIKLLALVYCTATA